jgi:hypothetical protein
MHVHIKMVERGGMDIYKLSINLNSNITEKGVTHRKKISIYLYRYIVEKGERKKVIVNTFAQ